MLKLVYLARRRSDLSHQALMAHWRDVNVADVAADLDPDRYVVTFFTPRPSASASSNAAERPHDWDGMATLVFDDPARGRALTESADLPQAAVRNGFAAMLGEVVRFEAREHVFFDGCEGGPLPDDAHKLTFLVVGRPGVVTDEIIDHWLRVHGPNVAAPMATIAGALRYVASPAVAGEGPYVGVTELWYADRGAAKVHAAALSDDGFTALADNSIFLAGRELTVR